jgi:ubiquinone/menaquinone biosynthesis C-methylase UbiE
MTEMRRTYLPAAGRDWMLPLYDPLVTLLGANSTRRELVERAALQCDHRVLEIGCGTGSLLIEIARLCPGATVVGLDPDPKASARARRKAEKAGASIQLDRGFADEMPYADAGFDRVFSSFMFHHLPAREKESTLREVRRVLKPGGLLLMLDFASSGRQQAGFLARHLHSTPHVEDTEDRVLAVMRAAGLAEPKRIKQDAVLFGRVPINYYEARRL